MLSSPGSSNPDLKSIPAASSKGLFFSSRTSESKHYKFKHFLFLSAIHKKFPFFPMQSRIMRSLKGTSKCLCLFLHISNWFLLSLSSERSSGAGNNQKANPYWQGKISDLTGHLPEPEGLRIPGSKALYLESHHRRGSDHCKVTSLSGWQHITSESAQGFWVSTALPATAPQTCHRACKSHSKHHCKARKDPDVYFLHILGFGMIPPDSD